MITKILDWLTGKDLERQAQEAAKDYLKSKGYYF